MATSLRLQAAVNTNPSAQDCYFFFYSTCTKVSDTVCDDCLSHIAIAIFLPPSPPSPFYPLPFLSLSLSLSLSLPFPLPLTPFYLYLSLSPLPLFQEGCFTTSLLSTYMYNTMYYTFPSSITHVHVLDPSCNLIT